MALLGDVLSIKELPHGVLIVGDRIEARGSLEKLIKNSLGQDANAFDLIEINTDSFDVKDGDSLRNFLSRKSIGQCKVSVISSSVFTVSAQNSLLKCAEEIANDSWIFILVASENILLPTLKSRLVKFNISRENEDDSNHKKLAIKFMKGTVSERINILEKMLKVSDDEDEKKKLRREVREFVEVIGSVIAKIPRQNNKFALEAVIMAGRMLNDPSAQMRLLLENIAYTLPETKE